MSDIIFIMFGVYLLNIVICAFINSHNSTRLPRDLVDFLKLTFLPYVLFNLEKIKEG